MILLESPRVRGRGSNIDLKISSPGKGEICIEAGGEELLRIHLRLSPERTSISVSSTPPIIARSYGLFACKSILHNLAELLTRRQWTDRGPALEEEPKDYRQAVEVSRALAQPLYAQWCALLSEIPDRYLQVSRTIFTACRSPFDAPGCESWPEFYEYPYLVQDTLRYRAAAIASHYALGMAIDIGNVPSSPFTDFMKRFFPDDPFAPYGFDRSVPEHRRALLDLLAKDWKQFYSHRGESSGSLRKTLMGLQKGVPAPLLTRLHLVEPFLTRPVLDRLELSTLCLFAQAYTTAEKQWEAPLFVRSGREEILAALHHLEKQYQRTLSPCLHDLQLLVTDTVGYCRIRDRLGLPAVSDKRTLAGLTKEYIQWSRTPLSEKEELQNRALREGTARTSAPPIALPRQPGIVFLATARAIYEEARHMGHCVNSYAKGAVEGQHYLFHIDYEGKTATVQVDDRGEVLQSKGPGNCANAATMYGKEKLTAWGKRLRHYRWTRATI